MYVVNVMHFVCVISLLLLFKFYMLVCLILSVDLRCHAVMWENYLGNL